MKNATPTPRAATWRPAKRPLLTVIRTRDVPDDASAPATPVAPHRDVLCTIQVATFWPCVAVPRDYLLFNAHCVVRSRRGRVDRTEWTATEQQWDRLQAMASDGVIALHSVNDWRPLGYLRTQAACDAVKVRFPEIIGDLPRPAC